MAQIQEKFMSKAMALSVGNSLGTWAPPIVRLHPQIMKGRE